MATIPSESDRFGLSAQDNSATAPATAVHQPQPESVLAEVPVLVHASHRSTVPGEAGKVQTVREETSTLAIFQRGAVLRLASMLSRGDLVVLTNRQNRADMLCRVVYMREQAGGGSYIELEFTQRSSTFWAPQPTAASEASNLASSALGEIAANSAPTRAPVLAFPQIARLPISLTQPPVSTTAPNKETPDRPADSAILLAPSLPKNAAPPTAPVAITETAVDSEPITSAARETFMRAEALEHLEPSQSEPPPLPSTRGDLVQKLKELSHSPMVWVFGAALTILAFFGESYLMGHRSPSNPAADVAASQAIYQAQPAAARTSEAHPSSEPITLNSISVVSSATPKDRSAGDTAGNKNAEDQPHHSALRIEKLAPVATKPSISASNEPPPVLPPQGANDAEYLIGAGSLSGAAAAGGPTPVAASVPGASTPAAPPSNYRPAKMIFSTAPVYPSFARAQGVEGTVVVDAAIDATGKVTGATVVSGSPVLAQAALNAVRQWKYQPAELNGQRVLSHATINVNFAR